MAQSFPNENGINEEPVHQENAASEGTRYYTGIDWAALLFGLLENIHWILLTAIVFGIAEMLYVKLAVTPIYQATSKIYIAGSETTISLSDLQLGSSLATDYQEAFKIWHVHEMVDERLGLDYSYSRLAGMISVNNPSGSHLLYINIKSSDPTEAKLLADTYADVIQDFIAEKMELRRPQILEVAQLPTRPISPNIKSSVIKAFVIGGFLAAAVVVFLNLLDDKIRTEDDVKKATGLATLGVVSRQEINSLKQTPSESPQEKPGAHTALIRKNLSLDYGGNESINMICSAIMFAGKNIKRIAITSHEANNGKTFISLRIAASMAARGKKVLIIDADLRKSVMVEQYSIINTGVGLAHLLSGQCKLEDAVYATNQPNLYLIPIGELLIAPLPLLTSDEFDQLMDYAGKAFDLVIVDTPPIGIVIDAAEIAKRCDGSILVLNYNKQTKATLRYMQRLMDQTKTPILGCVINNVTVKKLYRKRYYYRYGSYGGYGGKNGYGYYGARNDDKPKTKKLFVGKERRGK